MKKLLTLMGMSVSGLLIFPATLTAYVYFSMSSYNLYAQDVDIILEKSYNEISPLDRQFTLAWADVASLLKLKGDENILKVFPGILTPIEMLGSYSCRSDAPGCRLSIPTTKDQWSATVEYLLADHRKNENVFSFDGFNYVSNSEFGQKILETYFSEATPSELFENWVRGIVLINAEKDLLYDYIEKEFLEAEHVRGEPCSWPADNCGDNEGDPCTKED